MLTITNILTRYPIDLVKINGPELTIDDKGWEHNYYYFRLDYCMQSMHVPWRQGIGIHKEPTTKEILTALVLDSNAYDLSFEEWAEDFGFDPDSRAAEQAYNNCVKQSNELRELVGPCLFDVLRAAVLDS